MATYQSTVRFRLTKWLKLQQFNIWRIILEINQCWFLHLFEQVTEVLCFKIGRKKEIKCTTVLLHCTSSTCVSYCCSGRWEKLSSGVCGKSEPHGPGSTTGGRWWSHRSRDSSRTGSISFHLWSVSTKRKVLVSDGGQVNRHEGGGYKAGAPLCPRVITLQWNSPLYSLNLRASWCGTVRAPQPRPSGWRRAVGLVSGAVEQPRGRYISSEILRSLKPDQNVTLGWITVPSGSMENDLPVRWMTFYYFWQLCVHSKPILGANTSSHWARQVYTQDSSPGRHAHVLTCTHLHQFVSLHHI